MPAKPAGRLRGILEPVETMILVNGSATGLYESLMRAYPETRWAFHPRPLGFARAIDAGLRMARYGWTYLLNNDVVLDPKALHAVMPLRNAQVFSIASQVVLKDTTRFREETNWGSLMIDAGLATIHDWIPRSDAPVETFYSGGGASLFQTSLLRRLIDPSAYEPFYWEDVEWGWRTRKLGYRSLFCPASLAHHRQRATISRHFSPGEIETIIERNRILFQLRNLIEQGSFDDLLRHLAQAEDPVFEFFLSRGTRWKIARGRWWNHYAPIGDTEVFTAWNRSIQDL